MTSDDPLVWTAWCDGSALPNPGRMGWGAVIAGPDGERRMLSLSGGAAAGCNNEAELRGVMAALAELRTLGARAARVHCDNSVVVASFGEGAQQVDVRLVDRNQAALAQASDDGLYAARSVAGQQLLQNPDVGVPGPEQDLLTSGIVDGRILLTLGQLAATGRVDIADIAQLGGDPSGVHRQLVVSSFAGQDARGDAPGADEVVRFFSSLAGPLRPVSVERGDAGVIVTFSPDEPTDLLPRPAS